MVQTRLPMIMQQVHGGFLKTHDFLQVGKINAKEESTLEITSIVEKPPPPAPPPPSSSSVEHNLPGGIGTYSISHVSYFGQKVPKPEGSLFAVAQTSSTEKNDENSNCSSYTGSGFTLWEESAVKKGKTGKENAGERAIGRGEATVNVGQWVSQSSSTNNSHRNSFSSLSCSQPLGMKSQSFMEMIKSAKGSTHDDDLDDADEFILKRENSTTTNHKGDLRVKVEGKSNDQKPNTPRSKHSATEQRRRSKINDRFQMLRELIPHSDQKRDKASFLLEVIEYIQFLQEKVHKYEGPFVGWNPERAKLAPWKNNHKHAESYVDQSQGINNGSATALVFAAKFNEKNVSISPAIPGSGQKPVESDMTSASTFKTMDPQPGITNKAMPFPMSLQPNCYKPVRNGGAAASLRPRLASDAENTTSQPQTLECHTRSCTGDMPISNNKKLKEQELPVEGGRINISTAYSQGLLKTLTQALQSSGVDLSQASVSVQIDLGKRAAQAPITLASNLKGNEVPASNQGTTGSRDRNGGEGSNQALKKQKIDKC
ncbi:transcription factor BIM1 isoform X2 [Citrus sinensis]|uniref:transcription factor BIM1 isoform X2 n=1 Tax=Citrus sinensis TaxID=2711 RepID=UPI002279102B|nr:transcription factor BIM1 isoform X2 [Citrus sinensis]XP_052293824.1 transcription factor BIM1 isoform X2 [Citrus sinensis]